jgi:D-proline reductase (dithiol) PrdB
MDDAALRAHLATVPVPELPDPARIVPPPLTGATVAIVTTGAVHRVGEPGFALGDAGFRTFGSRARNLALGHRSPSFDRIGFAADVNVVTPVDRLAELAADGAIGAVAPRHVAFLGSQPDDLAVVRTETGPAAAELLRADGVDVVVLTPLGPMCTRTVCVLAHVLEAHGIATVALVSVEALARRMRPPRALAVGFPLGRPLGRPDDAPFQHAVLRSAFALLDEPHGPAFAVFPDAADSPDGLPASAGPWPPHRPASADDPVAEIHAWQDRYDAYVYARGRTSVGIAVGADGLADTAAAFARVAAGTPFRDAGLPGNAVACALDLRTYFEEAALSATGRAPVPGVAETWFLDDTATGRTLRAARDAMRAADAPFPLWYYLTVDTTDG